MVFDVFEFKIVGAFFVFYAFLNRFFFCNSKIFSIFHFQTQIENFFSKKIEKNWIFLNRNPEIEILPYRSDLHRERWLNICSDNFHVFEYFEIAPELKDEVLLH